MERPDRLRFPRLAARIAIAVGATLSALSTAETAHGENPLRPAVANLPLKPVAASAIGSSVREPVTAADSGVVERSVLSRGRAKPASASGVSSGTASTAAYRRRVGRPAIGFTPAHHDYVTASTNHEMNSGASVLRGTVTVQPPANEVVDGGIIYEEGAEELLGEMAEGDACCDVGDPCESCCLIPCPRIPWDNLSIFGGIQGFTGPKNLGGGGSFGFHEGVNWGAPLPCFGGCLGMQAGARFVQSNLSGTEFTPETRHQTFLTGGLFRRVDWGFQGGVVFDYLADDWYTNTSMSQLRAELSWVFPCGHELGFWMTEGTSDDTEATRIFVNQIPVQGTATWEVTNLYAAFYRHRFSTWEGVTGRLFAGFSGDSDGLIGADLNVPLSCSMALRSAFTYLAPEQTKGPAGLGNEQESWNVGISLVWYPGVRNSGGQSYFAPLFDVADNGSFLVD